MQRLTEAKDLQSSKIHLLKLRRSSEQSDNERSGRPVTIVERYEMPIYVARLSILIISALVVTAILWASLSKIDVIAEAPGKVIPIGDVKQVQPAFDGVIEKVLVVEGEQVTKDQPLVVLDSKPYAAEVKKREQELEISQSELDVHRRAQNMLEAAIFNPGVIPEQKVEIDGASQTVETLYSANSALEEASKDQSRNASDATLPTSDTALLLQQFDHLSAEKNQRLISLHDRTRELRTKRSALLKEHVAKQEELASSRLISKTVQSILAKTKQQANAYKMLFEDGGCSMVDVLQWEKKVDEEEQEKIKANINTTNLMSEIEMLKSQIAQIEAQTTSEIAERQAQINSLSSQLEAIRLKLRETDRHFNLTKAAFDVALAKAKAALSKEHSEISKGERQVTELQSALLQAEHAFDLSTMKAPLDGTVTVIKTLGPGQVVAKGQPLLTVVPSSCALVVEAKLPNKDIGFASIGQRARLKLAAFPFQDYGVLEGTVSEIEKHPQEDKKLGSYYKVIVVPKQDWIMAGGKKVHFTSGTALTAEIVLRRKSVLNVILEPIKKAADVHWMG